MQINNCKNLEDLWEHVKEINKKHFPENNLAPILGNGKTNNPEIMFVFINPTARNISSDPNWKGPRFPFIGTKQTWRIFNKAGFIEEDLIEKINSDNNWTIEFTNKVLKALKDKNIYLTNIVKWTGKDADLPDSNKINLFLPILEKEIELVNPKYIVTFGLIPFEKLTKQKIRLKDYYKDIITNKKLYSYKIKINSIKAKVIPCYFPVGRGDPKKAVEILKMLR